MSAIRYRADIDGLRAVAVLLVLIFHANLGVVPGGFIGVDVFFVISGYLITSIIVSEVRQGTFSWASFYERRIRRIMPALLTVIVASTIIGWFVLAPRDYMEFARSAIAAAAFYSNFYFNGQAGYFAPAAETQPLLHTWSLGVEEQFYLLAPVFILLLMGRLQRFKLAIFLTLFALSLAISVYGVREEWSSAFYLLPSRAFELMIGMALALGLVPAMTNRALRQVAGLAGLAMIVGAGLFYTSATPFPGLAALIPCLGAALLIHSGGQGDTLASRVLALRPAVFVGKVSYSLYLWHWPLLAYAAYEFEDQLTATHRVGLLILAFVLSVLSYYWIEQPARRGTILPTRRGTFVATAVAIACCAIVSVGIFKSRGALIRLSPEALGFAKAYEKSQPSGDICSLGIMTPFSEHYADCTIGSNEAMKPSFIVWGDSHARSVLPIISELAARMNIKGYAVIYGACPPLLGLERRHLVTRDDCKSNEEIMLRLLETSEIRHIVVHARWALYVEGSLPHEAAGGKFRFFSDDDHNRKEFDQLVNGTLRKLTEDGRTLAVVGPVPELPVHLPTIVLKDLMRNRVRDHNLPGISFHRRQAAVLTSLRRMEAMPRVHVLYPHHDLCDQYSCRTVDNGTPLYIDDDHLSLYGVRQLSEMLEAAMSFRGASFQAVKLPDE